MCFAFAGVNGFCDKGIGTMMEFLRNWMLGITAAAIILALADSLMPDGTVKKIGKLTGGLLLMIIVLRPFLNLNYESLAGSLASYEFEVQEYSTGIEVENQRLKKIIIEDRTGAYIQEKAKEFGIECSVEVVCQLYEKELLCPASITIYGEMTPEQMSKMSNLIEGEIAIPKDKQLFERKRQE